MKFEQTAFASLDFDAPLLARIRAELGLHALAEHLMYFVEWAGGSLASGIWSCTEGDPVREIMVARTSSICHRRFAVAANGHGTTQLVVADVAVRQPRSAVYATFGCAPSPMQRGHSGCNYSPDDALRLLPLST